MAQGNNAPVAFLQLVNKTSEDWCLAVVFMSK